MQGLRLALLVGAVVAGPAAAQSRRVFTYVDPNASADLDIDCARDCQTEGPGRVHAVNVP